MLFPQEERVSNSLSCDLPGSRPTAFGRAREICHARSFPPRLSASAAPRGPPAHWRITRSHSSIHLSHKFGGCQLGRVQEFGQIASYQAGALATASNGLPVSASRVGARSTWEDTAFV